MKYVLKVTTGGTKTACYKNKKGETVYVELKPGRNIVEQGIWERIKDTPFMKNKLKFDEITFSELVEEEVVVTDKISLEKAFGYLGQEDGKDLLADYALEYGYKLKKNKNIDNMLKDLKELVEGA